MSSIPISLIRLDKFVYLYINFITPFNLIIELVGIFAIDVIFNLSYCYLPLNSFLFN
nr:MAG TPA: hypothetical protein [Caudoviricetes sp.]